MQNASNNNHFREKWWKILAFVGLLHFFSWQIFYSVYGSRQIFHLPAMGLRNLFNCRNIHLWRTNDGKTAHGKRTYHDNSGVSTWGKKCLGEKSRAPSRFDNTINFLQRMIEWASYKCSDQQKNFPIKMAIVWVFDDFERKCGEGFWKIINFLRC